MPRLSAAAIAALSSLAAVALSAADAPPAKRPPVAVPDIPALMAGGATRPRSFVVDATVRSSAREGVGFRFATDGDKQLCSLYDPSDGTPLFLSDGWQTLVYDLPNGRIARIPNSRGSVRIDWDRHDPKPLGFKFNVNFESNRTKLDQFKSWFGIDAFVAASRPNLLPLETSDGTRLFSAERPGGQVESVQAPAGEIDWFRFTSMDRKDNFYRVELEARHVGRDVPAAALAFPDLARLKQAVRLQDLEQDLLPTMLAAIRDGRAWGAKLMLAAQSEGLAGQPPGVPEGTTWDDLRRKDKQLGAAYRAALDAQGVTYRPRPAAKRL